MKKVQFFILSLSFLLVNCNYKKEEQLVKKSSFTEQVLDSLIYENKKVNQSFFKSEIIDLNEDQDYVFFIYSKDICSSCQNLILASLYEFANSTHKLKDNIIVLSPDNSQMAILKTRYKDKINFYLQSEIDVSGFEFETQPFNILFTVSNHKVDNLFHYYPSNRKVNDAYFNNLGDRFGS